MKHLQFLGNRPAAEAHICVVAFTQDRNRNIIQNWEHLIVGWATCWVGEPGPGGWEAKYSAASMSRAAWRWERAQGGEGGAAASRSGPSPTELPARASSC